MTNSDDGFVLSSGREVYANGGIVGLTVFDAYEGLDTFYGYDGGLSLDNWTPAERVELADHMIARWQAFRVAILRVDKGYDAI